MKEAAKQISLLILALSFNLVWADSNFGKIAFFQNHPVICNEYSDTSNPVENFNLSSCEDDVFMNNLKVKANLFSISHDLVSFLKVSFRSDYLSNIWQPPNLA
jgi:hypothetical protein